MLLEACERRPRTLLELGSGGGNNASHLKEHFSMTLTDLSKEMLALSRTLNPECEHTQGDMRTLRLGRGFDAVFVHDAVMYMTTERDLLRAIETAYVNCRPGGVALFVPDCVREMFKPSSHCGGHDGADGRGLRYVEWTWDPDPDDTCYNVEFAMILREADGSVRFEQDRHTFGVFASDDWLRLLREAGFRGRARRFKHGDVFVGVKPT